MEDRPEKSSVLATQQPNDIQLKKELAKIRDGHEGLGVVVGSGISAGVAHYMTRDDLETAEQAARLLRTIINRQPQVRAINLARTHLDECMLWLRHGHIT